jgi:hypothetical protein
MSFFRSAPIFTTRFLSSFLRIAAQISKGINQPTYFHPSPAFLRFSSFKFLKFFSGYPWGSKSFCVTNAQLSQTKAQTQTPFLTFALILSLVFSQVFGLVFGASVAFAQVSGEGLAPTSLPVVFSPVVSVPDSSFSSPSPPYVAPVPDSPAPIPTPPPTPPAYIPPPTSSPADSLPSNPPPPSPLPITIDGSTNTQVTKTASGIDQVNIATPNGSGISMNRFVDYNINSSGQIINNFSGNVALDNSASYAIPGAGYSGEILALALRL